MLLNLGQAFFFFSQFSRPFSERLLGILLDLVLLVEQWIETVFESHGFSPNGAEVAICRP
jgi:hypothetical protein